MATATVPVCFWGENQQACCGPDREEVWDNFAQADEHREYGLAKAYLEVKLEGKMRHCTSVLLHKPLVLAYITLKHP